MFPRTYYSNCNEEDSPKLKSPMPWIGIYVAAASLAVCLAMAVDTFNGFRSKKVWFPSKISALNAASLTFLAIAMKMPLDLSTSMPTSTDQLAKLSSTALMSIVISKFMPSLGPMDDTELFTNITALGVLVITVAGNICIQLDTGLIRLVIVEHALLTFLMLACFVILSSSALIVPSIKKYLDLEYSKKQGKSKELGKFTVRELTQKVREHWMMAVTANPQFVMARAVTCSASEAICFLVAIILAEAELRLFLRFSSPGFRGNSDYKWSTIFILLIQSVGVGVGTIAPVVKWYAIKFQHSEETRKECSTPFKTENYWIEKLEEWKHPKNSHLPLRIRGSKARRKLVQGTKNTTLCFCIYVQILIVLVSKLVWHVFFCFISQFFSCCQRTESKPSTSGASNKLTRTESKPSTSGASNNPLCNTSKSSTSGASNTPTPTQSKPSAPRASNNPPCNTPKPSTSGGSNKRTPTESKPSTSGASNNPPCNTSKPSTSGASNTPTPTQSKPSTSGASNNPPCNTSKPSTSGASNKPTPTESKPSISGASNNPPCNTSKPSTSGASNNPNSEKYPGRYALYLEGEEEISGRILKKIDAALGCFIKMGRKNKPRKLMQFLQKYTQVEGDIEFDSNRMPPLNSQSPCDCWAVPVVTLTCIAVAISRNGTQMAGCDELRLLVDSVDEGLLYVHRVENSMDSDGKIMTIRNAAHTVWSKVRPDMKWLDQDLVPSEKRAPRTALKELAVVAENILMKFKSAENGGLNRKDPRKWPDEVIAAYSMHRISKTLGNGGSRDQADERLFKETCALIARILSACFTYLPHVITSECFSGPIEKRERSVQHAAQLLGETEDILEVLQDYEFPYPIPDQHANIDGWYTTITQGKTPRFSTSSK